MRSHDAIKTTKPATTMIIHCEACGDLRNYQDFNLDLCPCSKRCPTCDAIRPHDETFFDNGGEDTVCGACIIYCYCNVYNDLPTHVENIAVARYEKHRDRMLPGTFSPIDFARAAHIEEVTKL